MPELVVLLGSATEWRVEEYRERIQELCGVAEEGLGGRRHESIGRRLECRSAGAQGTGSGAALWQAAMHEGVVTIYCSRVGRQQQNRRLDPELGRLADKHSLDMSSLHTLAG